MEILAIGLSLLIGFLLSQKSIRKILGYRENSSEDYKRSAAGCAALLFIVTSGIAYLAVKYLAVPAACYIFKTLL